MSIRRQNVDRAHRRRFPRVARKIKMRVRVVETGEPDEDGETIDVGLGGVRATLRRKTPLGSRVNLCFEGLGSEAPIELPGCVTWYGGQISEGRHEFGIELLGLSREQQEEMLALVTDQGWTASSKGRRHYVHLRKHVIVAFRRANWWLGFRRQHASTTEMSLRGVLLHTDQDLPLKMRLNLRMIVPDGQPEPVECYGYVAEKATGAAPGAWVVTVAFDELSEEARCRIAAHLCRQLFPEQAAPAPGKEKKP